MSYCTYPSGTDGQCQAVDQFGVAFIQLQQLEVQPVQTAAQLQFLQSQTQRIRTYSISSLSSQSIIISSSQTIHAVGGTHNTELITSVWWL